MDTTCRLARTSGGLHSKPLPRAGSDMGSDQVAQGIILSGLETLQGRDSTLSLGLFPPPSHPCGRKAFPYLQPSWPCSMCCPPGPKTFCPELPLAPPALLPGLCLPGTGLHSALAWIVWRPHQPLPPTGPSPSAQWLCHPEHWMVHLFLGSPVNMTDMHLVPSPACWREAAVGAHLFPATRKSTTHQPPLSASNYPIFVFFFLFLHLVVHPSRP